MGRVGSAFVLIRLWDICLWNILKSLHTYSRLQIFSKSIYRAWQNVKLSPPLNSLTFCSTYGSSKIGHTLFIFVFWYQSRSRQLSAHPGERLHVAVVTATSAVGQWIWWSSGPAYFLKIEKNLNHLISSQRANFSWKRLLYTTKCISRKNKFHSALVAPKLWPLQGVCEQSKYLEVKKTCEKFGEVISAS